MARARRQAQSASRPEDGGALGRYRGKRDFARTKEPAGAEPASGGRHAYLIQKHDARRLHYDLRLELGGVLKSWAVTKGPSFDPADKRLAIHVEDHPLEYGTFEGTIPKGQYGGGTVMLWDEGTWTPVDGDPDAAYADGHMKIAIRGRKLKGRWALVRMGGKARREKQDAWLLIKEKDDHARPGEAGLPDDDVSVQTGRSMDAIAKGDAVWDTTPAEDGPRDPTRTKGAKRARKKAAPSIPGFVPPQLATLVTEAPGGQEWLHELKYDGYRLQIRIEDGKATVRTRNEKDWTHRFPALAKAAAKLGAATAILDGEAVVLDERGVSRFGLLQHALGAEDDRAVVLYAFDLLFRDGEDLRRRPLVERKEGLQALLGKPGARDRIRYSDHVIGQGPEMLRQAGKLGAEGIVAKRVDSLYRSGRGKTWQKVKVDQRQEFVIGGWTLRKDGKGGLGALLVGTFEGKELRYAGRVGSGWSDAQGRRLIERFEALGRRTSPFAGNQAEARKGASWVKPEPVAEIHFGAWTEDGILRHARLVGMREDKKAKEVGRERAAPPKPAASAGRVLWDRGEKEPVMAGVRISHPDRVVLDDPDITKGDLAAYYERAMDRILPEIKDRPLSVIRCPGGLEDGCFYQRHRAPGMPKSVRPITVQGKDGKAEEYFTVGTAEGVLALVQFNAIELHPWGAHADKPETPDRLIFDLDPDEGLGWDRVIEAALEMRRRLADARLESFVKTTGGKGLHVVAPIERRHSWNEAKAFASGLAHAMAEDSPKRFTATLSKQSRKGRLFVDYLRNDRRSTAVAAYSVRSRSGGPVAMPITWDEVTPALDPKAYTVFTVPDLLNERPDPWAGIARIKQRLPKS
ncbi:DNA ligase D [Marinivivus vitaminiproducens]|uniref:DNA ligase D n=1 Tax=Marinivivus vitaminiproducens TaxID=3035935 RepID=UPI002797DF0B|nr:DNA ligase D [Geminicoccaceae bacterium SCSIO 64248]